MEFTRIRSTEPRACARSLRGASGSSVFKVFPQGLERVPASAKGGPFGFRLKGILRPFSRDPGLAEFGAGSREHDNPSRVVDPDFFGAGSRNFGKRPPNPSFLPAFAREFSPAVRGRGLGPEQGGRMVSRFPMEPGFSIRLTFGQEAERDAAREDQPADQGALREGLPTSGLAESSF